MKRPPSKKKSIKAIDIMPEKMRSRLSVDEKELPAITKWQVGKKYKLVVEAELTALNKEQYGDKDMRGEFHINKIKSE